MPGPFLIHLAQRIEHVVVDGMTKDGTEDVLARYPHLKVIREPDRGQADAINKGFKVATGDVIRIGSPVGTALRRDPDDDADLLLVAGNSGVAPLMALLDDIQINVGVPPAKFESPEPPGGR